MLKKCPLNKMSLFRGFPTKERSENSSPIQKKVLYLEVFIMESICLERFRCIYQYILQKRIYKLDS